MIVGRGRGRGRGRDLSSMNGDTDRQAFRSHVKRISENEEGLLSSRYRYPSAVKKESSAVVLLSGKKIEVK